MEQEKLHELFERYAQGKMTVAERSEFELLIDNNPELQEEFKLQQELYHFYSDKKTNEFMDTLERMPMGDPELVETATPKNTFNPKVFILLGILALVALVIYLLLANNKTENTPVPIKSDEVEITNQKPTETTISEPQLDESKSVNANQENETVKTKEKPKGNENSNIEKGNKTIEATDQKEIILEEDPFPRVFAAADFVPNQELDHLIGSGMRGGEITLEMTTAIKDKKFIKDTAIDLDFSAVFESSFDYQNEDFVFYLFNNKTASYNELLPLLKYAPLLSSEGDLYKLSVDKTVKLNPGLYYYLIETKDEQLIYINKFLIE